MANTVKIKRSAVSGKVPLTTDLELGELALNTFDGKLYTKKDNGTVSIIQVGAGDFVGPASSTDNAIVRFDGTTGKLVQNSSVIIDDSGNVGIGTSTPSTKLDVGGKVKFTGTGIGGDDYALSLIYNNPGGAVQAVQNQSSTGWSIIRFLSDTGARMGSVGGGNSGAFVLSNTMYITSQNGYPLVFGTGEGAVPAERMHINSSGNVIANVDIRAPIFYDSNNTAYYVDAASTSNLNAANFAGNVGIGTSSPAYKLSVVNSSAGNAIIGVQNTSASGFSAVHMRDSAGTLAAHVGYGNASVGALASAAFFGSIAASPVIFTSSDTERMRIDASGNVGIRTTAPAYPLDVNGNGGQIVARLTETNATLTSRLYATCGTATGIFQQYGQSHATHPNMLAVNASSGALSLWTSSVERVRVETSGNVGIGTSAPGARLHLHDTAGGGDLPRMRFTNGGTGIAATDGMFVGISNTSQLDIWNFENDAVRVGTNNAERMRIAANGWVGIGRTPQGLFDASAGVNGTVSYFYGGGSVVYSDIDTHYFRNAVGTQRLIINSSGNVISSVDMRAPIFYDSNDTTYYVDPSSTSTSLNVAGNIIAAGDITANGGQVYTGTSGARVKFATWSDATYGIGMQTGYTYGGIANDYVISFQMSNNDTRGFWWGDTGHTNAQGAMALTTNGKLTVAHSVRVGFGESDTTVPGSTYALEVNGAFAATTKSFVIDHPTKPDMKLRYGSLEGPENGVYVRGRLRAGENVILLPDYWEGLVDQDTYTVNLTPVGKHQELFVKYIADDYIVVGGEDIDCFYTVFAERKDVEKLEVEF